jgi:hypothetical protein
LLFHVVSLVSCVLRLQFKPSMNFLRNKIGWEQAAKKGDNLIPASAN